MKEEQTFPETSSWRSNANLTSTQEEYVDFEDECRNGFQIDDDDDYNEDSTSQEFRPRPESRSNKECK